MIVKTTLILLLISVTSSTWVSAKYKVSCSTRPFRYSLWLKEADDWTDDDVISFFNTTECGKWTDAPCRNDIQGSISGIDEEFYRRIYFLFRHDCGVQETGIWRWKRIDLTSPDGKRQCRIFSGACRIEEILVNLDDD